MKKSVINVTGLSKRYRIGLKMEDYGTIREAILKGIKAPLRNLSNLRKLTKFQKSENIKEGEDILWALKNINFEVKQGEVLGIIGRNGAGKTTLLKILSRITEPTTGEVRIAGRVSSLLEVGTGFHHELTGRENIYLNGAILGMRKAEIKRKFDQIVEFAELEKFIDTPVKRYSSGMQVRLAFAVAAHLEPEILIVDEVLAVGDVAFQKKCLGKMRDVSGHGRTVLFVSHAMPTIESLCQRVIWIERGAIVETGEPRKVIADYVDKMNQAMEERKVGVYENLGHRRGSGEIQFTRVRLLSKEGLEKRDYVIGEDISLEVDFKAYKDIEYAVFTFGVVDAITQVFLTNWFGFKHPQKIRMGEQGTFSITLPNNSLRARRYYFYLGIVGNTDIPYDIWDGVGTEFVVNYPDNTDSLEFPIGRDTALVTLPMETRINIRRI
jgi:lipopolysaccharide transport system ATP-binding protein